MARQRVVIVGGGFGGVRAARGLARADVDVVLVDRGNYHLFQPLLYQVATGILSEGEVAPALRSVVRRARNVEVVLAEVTGIDLGGRAVRASAPDGRALELPYDQLVVAAGASHGYFGHDEWQAVAPGLKTLADARRIRTRVLEAFELAELEPDPGRRRALLTFVVVGGGPTGVELSGELAALARRTLSRDFREIEPADARVVLVEAGPAILPTFHESLRRRAVAHLAELGAIVRTATRAVSVDAGGIDLEAGGETERIDAHTIVWAAGVSASPAGRQVAGQSGAELDRAGRVCVLPDLTVPGRPEVFVIGDLASLGGLPGVAPVAMQQGTHVARTIAARVAGRREPGPFRYRDRGTMAAVGPRKAVVDIHGLRVGGLAGSVIWAFVHILYLVGWGNRLVTVTRWLFALTVHTRSQRVIDVRPAHPDAAPD